VLQRLRKARTRREETETRESSTLLKSQKRKDLMRA